MLGSYSRQRMRKKIVMITKVKETMMKTVRISIRKTKIEEVRKVTKKKKEEARLK